MHRDIQILWIASQPLWNYMKLVIIRCAWTYQWESSAPQLVHYVHNCEKYQAYHRLHLYKDRYNICMGICIIILHMHSYIHAYIHTHHTYTTHIHMHYTHYTHTHTTHTVHTLHTHTHTKSLATAKQSCQSSKPALGCLGTTQALKAGASKPTWGRVSNPQMELCYAPGWWCGHPRSHLDLTH